MIGVLAASFDIVTKAHIHLIKQGLGVVDKLIVAVGDNPDKLGKYIFNQMERVAMLKELLSDEKRAIVVPMKDMFLIDFATGVKADFIIRGIRDEDDLRVEMELRDFNYKVNPNIETIFFFTPIELRGIRSSTVKGLLKYSNWNVKAKMYISDYILCKLIEKLTKGYINLREV